MQEPLHAGIIISMHFLVGEVCELEIEVQSLVKAALPTNSQLICTCITSFQSGYFDCLSVFLQACGTKPLSLL